MLNISHTRLVAAVVGCLAIAAASISLAQDQPPAAAQPNQPPAATQPDATANSPTDATSSTSQQPGAATNQPASERGEQPGAQQSSSNAQQSAGQPTDAQNRKTSNTPDWPAPERYGAPRPGLDDSPRGQGASLGVSIMGDGQGITVTRVYSGTPAQQMGLRPRDRITSVNGQNVESADEFITLIRSMNPGDEVALGVVRNEQPTTVRGKLEPLSEARRRAPVASGEDWTPNPLSNSYDQANSLRRTSYEERNQSGRSQRGDIEARLSRVEQQLSQLTRDVTEIRNAIRPNQSTSPAAPVFSTPGRTGPEAPSTPPPTPGQPPNNNLNNVLPQNR